MPGYQATDWAVIGGYRLKKESWWYSQTGNNIVVIFCDGIRLTANAASLHGSLTADTTMMQAR